MSALYPETEAAFQEKVMALAILHGWDVAHFTPAMMPNGRWFTPIKGRKGFPDLVMVHSTRGTIFVELKAAKGRLSPDQTEWLRKLNNAGNEVYVWRPSDMPFITKRLAGIHNDPT